MHLPQFQRIHRGGEFPDALVRPSGDLVARVPPLRSLYSTGGTRMFRGTPAPALAFIVLAGCGGTTVENGDPPSADPAVIARIENGTSCTALQREFDIAMDDARGLDLGDPYRDISLTYANAANNRMREIGCSG
jgi:hypothetical protein